MGEDAKPAKKDKPAEKPAEKAAPKRRKLRRLQMKMMMMMTRRRKKRNQKKTTTTTSHLQRSSRAMEREREKTKERGREKTKERGRVKTRERVRGKKAKARAKSERAERPTSFTMKVWSETAPVCVSTYEQSRLCTSSLRSCMGEEQGLISPSVRFWCIEQTIYHQPPT